MILYTQVARCTAHCLLKWCSLKNKVVNERYSLSEICHQLLKNPFPATHVVLYRVPETFVAHCTGARNFCCSLYRVPETFVVHCTWRLHRVCNYQIYVYICWSHRCPGKNNPVSIITLGRGNSTHKPSYHVVHWRLYYKLISSFHCGDILPTWGVSVFVHGHSKTSKSYPFRSTRKAGSS